MIKQHFAFAAMLAALALLAACAEDWEDVNPAPLLDAPALLSLQANADTVQAGTTVSFTASVSDAPGTLDSVAVSARNVLGLEVGTISNISFPQGSTSGAISFDYLVPNELRGPITITLSVFDRQMRDGDLVRKNATQSTLLYSYCREDLSGIYNAVATGSLGDDGGEYADLLSTINITDQGNGVFLLDDMSFGVYPQLYEDLAPGGRIVLSDCQEGSIMGLEDTDRFGDPFTITGTVQEDGSLLLVWSNTFGDTGEVTLTPSN